MLADYIAPTIVTYGPVSQVDIPWLHVVLFVIFGMILTRILFATCFWVIREMAGLHK